METINNYSKEILELYDKMDETMREKTEDMILINEGPFHIKGKTCLEFMSLNEGVIFISVN